MNLLKKNQVVITALVIMVVIAGYLSYTQKNTPEDAQTSNNKPNNESIQTGDDVTDILDGKEVSTNSDGLEVVDDTNEDGEDVANVGDNQTDPSNAGEAVFVNTQISANEYFIQAKFNREQARAKSKETYLEVINNNNLTEAQKNEAIVQMLEIANNQEKEATAEDLLLAKGFAKSMVRINDVSVDVVVTTDHIDDQSRAQIEDIVKRATGVEADKIVITPVKFEKSN